MGAGEKTSRDVNRCVIIAAGEMESDFDARSVIDDDAFIICADGGYDTALSLGVTPHLFVGDMDSVLSPPDGVQQVLSPAEKDDTDTMLAVKIAIKRGYRHITILAGLGGRLDHTIANLQTLLYCAKNGVYAVLAGKRNSAFVIKDEVVTVPAREGFVSVFSLTERCEGVTLKGLRYPLCDALVTNSFPIGVSNEFCEPVAEISVRTGCLLVVFSDNRR